MAKRNAQDDASQQPVTRDELEREWAKSWKIRDPDAYLHPPVRWRLVLGVAVVALMIGMAGMWLLITFWPAPDPPVRKFTLRIPGRVPSSFASTISPDGRAIAYIADGRLWIRFLDRIEPRVVIDSEGAALPFWSPGSDTVGYFDAVNGAINVVPTDSGDSRVWCRLPTRGVYGGGTWGPDGTIIFSQGPLGLFTVPARDAKPATLLRPDSARNDAGFYAPHILPDGRTIVFSVWKKDGAWALNAHTENGRVRLMEADPGELVTAPSYAPTGHLLYNRVVGGRQSIWAAPFSVSTLSIEDTPFLVASPGGWPSVSRDNTLVYSAIRRTSQQQLVWKDREGKTLGPVGQPHEQIFSPELSPEEDRVAVSAYKNETRDIWIHDILQSTKTRLTFDEGRNVHPVWSPDGEQIAFSAEQGDSSFILVKAPHGCGEVETLFAGPLDVFNPVWSRDGYYMAFQMMDEASGARDLWFIPLQNPGPPVRFTETPHDEALPQFSPDGRYLAYQSNASGQWEVYVTRFPDGSGSRQVSLDGGAQPRWSYWSEELFYIRDDRLMAIQVQTEPRFSILHGAAALFDAEELSSEQQQPVYDVADDGQRFVVIQQGVEVTASTITVVQNWHRDR